MYFQIVSTMIKTRTGMILDLQLKIFLQQLRARNSAIVTLTASISRMEALFILEIVGSNPKR